MGCFCQSLNSQTPDLTSECLRPYEKAWYYNWLNITCGGVASWQGLPSNWTSLSSSLDLLSIGLPGATLETSLDCFSPNTTSESGTSTVLPQYLIPDCVNIDCPALSLNWSNSLISEYELGWVEIGNNHNAGLVLPHYPCGLYLSRTGTDFCGLQSMETPCPSMCSTKLERTEYLLWLNSTCSGAKVFSGMPANWTQEVEPGIGDATSHNISDLVFPACTAGECERSLSLRKNASLEVDCVLDPSGTYCNSTQTQVSYAQFCNNFSYPSTCLDFCTKSYDRPGFLTFMNNTCSSISGWSGLPANWTNLLHVVQSDLQPWPEVIRNHSTTLNHVSQNKLCPSPETNIGVFAAINVAMLLLTPFFGRRKVVERITFGRLGHAHSKSWIFMGPLLATLQLLVNITNALIIKRSSGYSHISIKTLVLLWCTRPRMSWMVILLIPFQAEQVMYFNCAASSLFSELILQFLSSYTFGFVANYAHSQHFYLLDHRLDGVHNAAAAKLMYGGALLWLIVVLFCLVMVTFSIIGVDRLKGSLASMLSWGKKLEGKPLRKARAFQDSTRERYSHLSTIESMIDGNAIDHLPELLEARSQLLGSCDAMVQSHLNIAEWVRIEEQEYRRKRSQLKKLESKNKTSHKEIERARSIAEKLGVQFEATLENNFIGRRTNEAIRQKMSALRATYGNMQYESEYHWRLRPLALLEEGNVTPYEVIEIGIRALAELRTQLEETARNNINSVLATKQATKEQISAIDQRLPTRWPSDTTEVGRIEQQWRDIKSTWVEVARRWEKVYSHWCIREYHARNIEEFERKAQANSTTVTISIAFAGMFGCWLSQWIFWAGFVHLYSNQE